MKWIKRLVIVSLLLILTTYLLLVILGGGWGTSADRNMLPDKLNFAHRGCCKNLPRNSMAAFDQAVKKGLAIETDVRMTKDGVLVLFHDDTTDLKLGLPGHISDWDYDQLSDKHFFYPSDSTEHHIITLKKLQTSHPETVIYLDIKTPSKQLADVLLNEIKGIETKNLIADANILFLTYLKHKNPNCLTVWEGFGAGKEWLYFLIPKNYKPDYVASFRKDLNVEHIQWLKENHLLDRKMVYGDTKLDEVINNQIPYQIIECK